MTASYRWLSARVPESLFAFCLLGAAAVLILAGSGLTFFYDEWELILDRPGLSPDALLAPHNGQLFLVPVVVYKFLLNAFGMGTQLPFRVVAVGFVSLCGVLLFVFVRRRIGGWMALALTLPVLCLGGAWEALLLPLSMNFLISLAAGMGMMLVLERSDTKGDVSASILLCLSIAAGGLGIAFAAGAAADLLMRRDPRRIWIAGIPVLLVGIWMIGQGSGAGGDFADADPVALPGNVFRSLSTLTEAVSGLSFARRPGYWIHRLFPGSTDLDLGRVLAGSALVAVAIRIALAKRFPVPRNAWIVASVLVAFWVLTGLMTGGERQPDASRYIYPGAVLSVALVATLLEGMRLPRMTPVLLLPLIAYSVWASMISLQDGRNFLVETSAITRGAVGALEEGRGREFPGLRIGSALPNANYLTYLDSGLYFRAKRRYGGSVGFSREQIETATPAARAVAARIDRLVSDRVATSR